MNFKQFWKQDFNKSQKEMGNPGKVQEIRRFYKAKMNMIRKNMFLGYQKTFLDLGCANGNFLDYILTNPKVGLFTGTKTYLGIDFSKDMLIELKQNHYKIGVLADVESIPVKSNSFDNILCSSVICCLSNPYILIGECHRILKPGGTLYLVGHNSYSPIQQIIKILNFILNSEYSITQIHNPYTLKNEISFFGFQNIDIKFETVYIPERFKKYGMMFLIKAEKRMEEN